MIARHRYVLRYAMLCLSHRRPQIAITQAVFQWYEALTILAINVSRAGLQPDIGKDVFIVGLLVQRSHDKAMTPNVLGIEKAYLGAIGYLPESHDSSGRAIKWAGRLNGVKLVRRHMPMQA